MQVVGDKLQEWAKSEKEDCAADLFGRSAFNRYYYSAYLVTRAMLFELDPHWARMSHKAIPDFLQNGFPNRVRKEIQRALKSNMINAGRASRYRTTLNSSTSNLANLLLRAYDIRVVADYEPDKAIIINGTIMILESETASSASHWHNKASLYTKEILRIWKELGLG